ncbi:PAS domain-containing sensor histidine kinase [Salinispira pacifica]|uniref:histidine kinase n=1 Tax=Salinispira pacifica TaxID=1307761 RepID=V5WGN3_9SPIO|nr:PAS domain S-box protein [Salinispira pacifica]AHC14948.1 two-component hybrid sensor and regulator [Salinispira pacifica]
METNNSDFRTSEPHTSNPHTSKNQTSEFHEDFPRIINLSREMICIHDADGTYIYINPAGEEISGYPASEMLGTNPYDYFHPEDKEMIRAQSHSPALDGDNTVRMVYRFIRKDGNIIWLETLTRPIFNAEGTVIRLHTSSRDISDQVHQQREILERNALLTLSQELSGIGSWSVDLETGEVHWSKQVRRIHDLDDNTELDLDSVLQFYAGESRQLAEDRLKRIIHEGRGFDERLLVRTARGRMVWTRVVGEVYQENEIPTRVYGVCQDIDEEYRYQKELQKTVDLLTARNRQMEDISRMLGHNLRGPAGNINMILDSEAGDGCLDRETVDMLRDNSAALLKTLTTMLDLVKSTVIIGKPEQPVTLFHAYMQALMSLETMIRSSKAKIREDFSAVSSLRYPEIYLESYFFNFISNAVKYRHDQRPPEIEVFTRVENGFVILVFRDNGRGIDLEKYGDKLFGFNQRLSMSEPGKENAADGSGLGLFMCKNQVESFGGTIDVESKVNEGSEFQITLGTVSDLS